MILFQISLVDLYCNDQKTTSVGGSLAGERIHTQFQRSHVLYNFSSRFLVLNYNEGVK